MYGKKPTVFPETLSKQMIYFSLFRCFFFPHLVNSSLFHVEWHDNSGTGRDLRRSLVQPLVQNRVNYEIKSSCSKLYPSGSWKFPMMETIPTLWATFSPAGLSSWGKCFYWYPARTSYFSLLSSSCQARL